MAKIVHEHVITGDASAYRRWYVRASCEAEAVEFLRAQDDVCFYGWSGGPGQSFGYQANPMGWSNTHKAYLIEQFSGLDI